MPQFDQDRLALDGVYDGPVGLTDELETRGMAGRMAAATIQLARLLHEEGKGFLLTVELQDRDDGPAHPVVRLDVPAGEKAPSEEKR